MSSTKVMVFSEDGDLVRVAEEDGMIVFAKLSSDENGDAEVFRFALRRSDASVVSDFLRRSGCE